MQRVIPAILAMVNELVIMAMDIHEQEMIAEMIVKDHVLDIITMTTIDRTAERIDRDTEVDTVIQGTSIIKPNSHNTIWFSFV